MPGAGPKCSICGHPQRHEIDRLLALPDASNRRIASQYGFTETSIRRHKQAGHVSEALVVYETERKVGSLITTAEIFHRNVERLSLAQDAVHRWLTDPDDPTRYDIGARAEEVTVHYEEFEWIGDDVPPIRHKRKAKLHVLLNGLGQDNGIRITGFETKFADPRKLLTDYSGELRGEIQMFLQAWQQWQDQQKDDRERAQRQEDAATELREVLTPELLAECLEGLVDEELAKRVGEYQSARLCARLLEREE